MVVKHKQKKKKNLKTYGKSNKVVLNALIEKKFQKFVINKKRRKIEKKSISISMKCRFLMIKSKKIYLAWKKSWKVEKFHPLVLNEK